jgi:hypothetical protein
MIEDEESSLDADILAKLARRVITSEDGATKLVEAAQNSPDPGKGVAQYLIMLIEQIAKSLEQYDINVNHEVWMARDGVIDELLEDIEELLVNAGVQLDSQQFRASAYGNLADMAKGMSQAGQPQQPASPTAGASDMLAQAPLLG